MNGLFCSIINRILTYYSTHLSPSMSRGVGENILWHEADLSSQVVFIEYAMDDFAFLV